MLTTAIALLPDDVVDHQVWLRSMLVSVLVETDEIERQEQLSDEALAIARRTDEPGPGGLGAATPGGSPCGAATTSTSGCRSPSTPSSTPGAPATCTSS